jgi:hypothetical protein
MTRAIVARAVVIGAGSWGAAIATCTESRWPADNGFGAPSGKC